MAPPTRKETIMALYAALLYYPADSYWTTPEATMAKRLVRARQKIKHAQIPYRVPSDAELPEPAVALNRAIAIGERDGPAAQLAALDASAADASAGDPGQRSHWWHAARADALRRLGRIPQAREELRTAAELATSAPERRLLAVRLTAL
jgi:predicted RNA polymerase sigma factor